MKPTLAAVTAGLILSAHGAFAADDVPQPLQFARYEPMMNRSPFAVATAPVATPPPAPNFAKDWYIANTARTPDGDLVTVASSTDKNFKEYLTTKEPVKGVAISNIEWSDRVGGTKVTVTKEGQFATLTFNQALLTQPISNPGQPQPPPQQPTQGQPGTTVPQPAGIPTPPGTPGNAPIKPAPIPTLPTPPPRVRSVIQRNPNAQTGQPAQPAPAPDAD